MGNDNEKESQRLKMDQIMKVLFKLSKKVTIDLINALFDEDFDSREVTLEYGDSEFIDDDYERIIGDLFITLRTEQRIYRYHIEFQTLNDASMIIRMFEYGFRSAVERLSTGARQELRVGFPKQLVIFLEENENIGERLACTIILPDGNEIRYIVPTMQYWKYSAEYLRDRKMYALLPLQVFKFRKRIKAIYDSNRLEEEKGQLINNEFDKMTDEIKGVLDILKGLHQSEELPVGDLERILKAMANITEYLYNKYGVYRNVDKEVIQMVTTLYDPIAREEAYRAGQEEGREEGILLSKIEDLIELLSEHGKIEQGIKARIDAQTDVEVLKKWIKLAAKVDSIDEFVAKMDTCI